MTISKRYNLEPSDILSLNISCYKCKTSLNIPPEGFKELGENCPNCQAMWFIQHDEKIQKLKKLATILAELSGMHEQAPFHVAFEFDLPEA